MLILMRFSNLGVFVLVTLLISEWDLILFKLVGINDESRLAPLILMLVLLVWWRRFLLASDADGLFCLQTYSNPLQDNPAYSVVKLVLSSFVLF